MLFSESFKVIAKDGNLNRSESVLKNASLLKRVIFIGVFSLGLILAYNFGQSVAQHGSLSGYWEARKEAYRIQSALSLINNYYVEEGEIEMEDLTESALEGMVSDLDPYSSYLNLDDLKELRQETSQEFGGIGIQVEVKERRLTIVAPIEGTPGFEAGLMRGDQILEVDGKNIEGMPIHDTVELLRGRAGSKVEILVYRPKTDEEFEKSVERRRIDVDSVKDVQLLSNNVGYLRILQFGEKTAEEMKQAIASLEAQGMKGLVIDLRNNPGGLLEAAVEVVETFLDRGELIVYTEGRHSGSNEQWYSKNRGGVLDLPLAILVNSGSASASEIVAGALKDTGKAEIIGEKTFGKGSVQSILSLGNGSGLRLTTAKYYTPGGYVIQGKGIEPDLSIEVDIEEDRKLAIQRNRLPLMTREEFVEEFEFEPIEDQQLNAAREVLAKELSGASAKG
ncbi:MAG: S41 family peptidase [Verrucomicrobiota bacterium]